MLCLTIRSIKNHPHLPAALNPKPPPRAPAKLNGSNSAHLPNAPGKQHGSHPQIGQNNPPTPTTSATPGQVLPTDHSNTSTRPPHQTSIGTRNRRILRMCCASRRSVSQRPGPKANEPSASRGPVDRSVDRSVWVGDGGDLGWPKGSIMESGFQNGSLRSVRTLRTGLLALLGARSY